ncbi:LpqB family beta-propeller domain-containing protein [Mobiluncus mulieris]|uniref:LpqB family beta-propeller domain-containing protein n=1 Tax=Mobiluncus mulieris TaxID=2052 RepID=UPI000E0E4870|nr:LpqB family beta-propeller domain-containing protein [Mobiluncus mulieris]
MFRKSQWWGRRATGMSPHEPRYVTIAALLIGTVSLGACATLPYAGTVQKSDIEIAANQPLLGLNAPGPVPNASPEEIVRGFIRACAAGYSDDFTVARSFLASKAAVDWKPDAQVVIVDTDSGIDITTTSDAAVQANAKAVGSVDSSGKYSVANTTSEIQERFSLVKAADNQWRIANLEDGVILSQSVFASIYASAPIFFLAANHGALIPDLRWYPRRRMASYLVNAILAGPPRSFRGAATSVFPPGTSLRGGTVEVFDGVANVNIDSTQPFTDPHTIALAYWQIGSTLRDVAGISSVSLSLGNVPLPNTEPISDPSGVVNPVMIKDGNLVRLDGDKVEVLLSASNLAGISMSHPAVSVDGKTIAFTDGARQKLYVWKQRSAQVLYSGLGLAAPVVDRLGWIWTVDSAQPNHILAYNDDGSGIQIELPWHDSRIVTALAISPDGSRLAAIRSVDGKDQISLAIILRNQYGLPETLVGTQELEIGTSTVADLSWLQGYTLAALTGGGEKTTVRIIPLFGPVSTLPGVKDAVALAGGRTENEVYLATKNGELFSRSGRNWQHTLSGVQDPTYPG